MVWSFSLLFLFFLLFLLSLPLFSFTFYYIPPSYDGSGRNKVRLDLYLDKETCDLTCVWTKWLVTWLDLTSDQMTCDLTWTCKELTCDLTWTCKKWLAAISALYQSALMGLIFYKHLIITWPYTMTPNAWSAVIDSQLALDGCNQELTTTAQVGLDNRGGAILTAGHHIVWGVWTGNDRPPSHWSAWGSCSIFDQ